MNSFKIKSHAKVNLALNVIGKSSKLHRIESVVSFLDFHDLIYLKQIDKKNRMQEYLKNKGFVQPFSNINYPWFKNSEMEDAQDCMYTFSTSDWMLLDRHRGKWKYKTLDDLTDKIDNDPYLNSDDSHSIILIHDKPEPEFPPIFKCLIDHMVTKGYEFLSIT